ncbi:MAG TPA: cytidine deaminase [Candidatus Limnocylindrales bacterium]|nr:cytidine deaminase [Candidatus Limnocylindrales bacterium]
METLLAAARAARVRAYAPYSKFQVGAALLTEEGVLFTGSNTENASLGLTVCAERVAVWSAVHAGYHKFEKIAIAADCSPPPTPCGACRQVLWELAGDIEVIMGNLKKEIVAHSLLELLPQPFGAEQWAATTGAANLSCPEEMWRLPVSFNPVGYVVSDYQTPGTIPDNYKELIAQIVIDPELEDGLYRLEEEKKLIIIAYLHQSRGYKLKEKRSGRGNEVYGIFACRAPLRPNALAQTTVDLIDVQKNRLTVKGIDLINGTPVLDIKTVLPVRSPAG